MDDFFQILIYIFIIVSFLSSILKKRKKPENKISHPVSDLTTQPQLETKSSQQTDYDILKEIEKMFKPNIQTEEIEKKKTSVIESEHFNSDEWHQPTETEHEPTTSEHAFENWDQKRRKADDKRKAINEKIIKQAEMFEKRLSEKVEPEIKKNIRQQFKNPASLKEYIIFSEIIGKPKALSRGFFGQE